VYHTSCVLYTGRNSLTRVNAFFVYTCLFARTLSVLFASWFFDGNGVANSSVGITSMIWKTFANSSVIYSRTLSIESAVARINALLVATS
jgi:hypothetical protein